MSHDQNFKNIILDYPLEALRFFAPTEAQKLSGHFKITPLRQEQLKHRLGDRFRELDCPLQVEWPHGERAALLFAVEEETEPRHFSIHRLAHYCLDLAELCQTDRVVPVVVFLHAGECAQSLRLGSGGEPYLGFRYVACHLPRLSYATYQNSDNIVACLNLLNMRYDAQHKVAVYAQSMRRLLCLEQQPDKQAKYIDFIDIYGNLSAQEQQQYQRDYPEEERIMMGRLAQARQEGRQEGVSAGIQRGAAKVLLAQLKLKFGTEVTHTVREQVAQADPDTLQHWSEQLLGAQQLAQILNSQPGQ
jgi:predicted DNA-binding protein YlxM (UPF0122 family)